MESVRITIPFLGKNIKLNGQIKSNETTNQQLSVDLHQQQNIFPFVCTLAGARGCRGCRGSLQRGAGTCHGGHWGGSRWTRHCDGWRFGNVLEWFLDNQILISIYLDINPLKKISYCITLTLFSSCGLFHVCKSWLLARVWTLSSWRPHVALKHQRHIDAIHQRI